MKNLSEGCSGRGRHRHRRHALARAVRDQYAPVCLSFYHLGGALKPGTDVFASLAALLPNFSATNPESSPTKLCDEGP